MRSPARWLNNAAAICERPALCTQTNRTLGLSAISWGSSVGLGSEQPIQKRQGHVDQSDQHRYFDQWADYPGQGLPGSDAVGGDRYRDGQLKIVAGGGECQGG